MEDLLLTKEADDERKMLIQRAYNIGSRSAKAWADSEGGKVEIESVKDNAGAENPLKPVEAAAAAAKIGKLLSGSEGRSNFAELDGYMQSQLNPLASDIIKACLPKGSCGPFPN
jgi:DNA-directed RNA polymerase I subunit RPA1